MGVELIEKPINIAFVLSKTNDRGVSLSLDNVDFLTYMDFLETVKQLIAGGDKTVHIPRPDIENGSLKAVLVISMSLFTSFNADMDRAKAGDIDKMNTTRRKALEKLEKDALKDSSYSFLISDGNKPLITLLHDKPIIARKRDFWIPLERIIEGDVTNVGGSTDPNLHLVHKKGENAIVIKSDKKTLESFPYLYQNVRIKIKCEENMRTGMRRNYELIEIIDKFPKWDEDAYRRVVKTESKAWADVKDPVAWVNELRGVNL